MNLSEAKALLNDCVREELRDHAFGDAELFWFKDGKEIATGYFGGMGSYISFQDGVPSLFKGEEARELRECGREGHVERNDEVGPDEFVEGKLMPGLTFEGIRKELTGE